MNDKPKHLESEAQVREFWKQAGIFELSVKKDAPKGEYVFYDGPPFATGTPHYGHLVANVMKDVVPRFWTMNGYRVERKWGWDCHGLPVENIVEKELNITNKQQILELGVDKFNELCRSKVLSYVDDWKEAIFKLGRFVDMENDYKTMDLAFMESVWWVFKQLYDKNLVYEGYRSMYICPRCETTLSQSEVSEGYKDIKDLSVTVKFELTCEPNTFLLAWTTTPWTLPGNVALAIGKDIDYVKVECTKKLSPATEPLNINNLPKGQDVIKEFYILSKTYFETEGIQKKFNQDFQGHKIVGNLNSNELIGREYKPLFDYYSKDEKLPNHANGWKIYAADFVLADEGTGIVHIAPAFGEDDMNLGKEKNLPFVQHVGMNGILKPEVTDFAGLHVKPIDDVTSTDVEIIKYLANHNLLFSKEKYEHSYPHCWRCETPLINYATSSWFVSVTKIKDDLLKTAEQINWSPDYIKEGRFGNWLEGARDWSISRQRFWASVMPIWKCEKCKEIKVFGSAKELEEASGQKVTDLHKHIVDKITFPCEKCGSVMKRIPDVLDTWFDSGSMPYAQMHYPFENKERFEANFPAKFIAEGIDQTRCWFYYLHVLATALKNKPAYQNVIVNGTVLAEDGKKMSKRLKNYPDTNLIFDTYGADALRAYLLSSPVVQAENLNFSEKGVAEAMRKNIMLLWNVHAFYEMYQGGRTTESSEGTENSDNVLDVWIIAKLNQLIAEVTKQMTEYNLVKAMRPITEFIDELSTWYLRRSRDRFKEGPRFRKDDKQNALATMKYVLENLSKVMAPFTPFISEAIWQAVTGTNFKDNTKSVHLEQWPNTEKTLTVRTTESPEKTENSDEKIINDMNVVRRIVEMGLAKRDEHKIKIRQPLSKLKVKSEKLKVSDEELINLIKDELNVKEVEFSDGEEGVELDVTMTPELEREGLKRELVRAINNLRKNNGLTIKDQIKLYCFSDDEMIKETLKQYQEEIKTDTLSSEIIEEKADNSEEQKINDRSVYLAIVK
jgi:isoleucyl-tRNA synthetase